MAREKRDRSTAKYHGIKGDFDGQCEAAVSNGSRRCKNHAKPGSNVCEFHGSKAPQVKEAARQRLAALVAPSIAKLESFVRAKKTDKHIPANLQLAAARDILDRNGLKPKDEVVLTAELDESRFKNWSDDKLKQFIAMAREVSTLSDATDIDDDSATLED